MRAYLQVRRPASGLRWSTSTTYRSGYARDLYSLPAFKDTTNFGHIKRHYYTTHPHINPTRIVPDGPLLGWAAPHNRALS